jgi:hypothetical protein
MRIARIDGTVPVVQVIPGADTMHPGTVGKENYL